ncbi:MAG: hypothetical protein EBT62_07410, partial [Opitutaceae bacterium]|nr:hypothetical protein [Opitutaceae bacterium]
DGASVGELRILLTPGPHQVTVQLLTQPKRETAGKSWSALIKARSRHLTVLTLEANRGFEFAP